MDKNVVWAVVISSLFLMGWYHFFQPAQKPVSLPAAHSTSLKPTPTASIVSTTNRAANDIPAGKVVETTVDAPGARIIVASRGAAVKHWWLMESRKKGPDGEIKTVWGPDLVNYPKGSEESAFALPLETFGDLNFEEAKPVRSAEKEVQSIWRAKHPSGVEVEKKYSWNEENFLTLTVSLKNPGKAPAVVSGFKLGWNGGLGTVESERKENNDTSRALAYPSPKKELVVFKKGGEDSADYSWMGIDNRYYLFAMMPEGKSFTKLSAEKTKTNPAGMMLDSGDFSLEPGETKSFVLRIYAGPKRYVYLKGFGIGLDQAVDFGYFGFLGKSALKVMGGIVKVIGNYGWAIVILTFMLQLIVLPLSIKSYKSMAVMKLLQPKIQELQKRYKGDPTRLNQEMMALYKQSGTNPFGGCLPMILQIPVFWAFFTMLRNSYELRGAPWMFWIKDLSQKDPYYVLPIVMGAGMFLQQKLSGPGGDPTQAKIMMLMPVIFTFMFLNFSSGLVLYWLTNSILSMAVQYYCTQKYGQPKHA